MPLPVGEVLSDRDKALKAMEMLREVLGERKWWPLLRIWCKGTYHPRFRPHPPPSPTEEERMERHAALLRKRRAVEQTI